MELGLRRQDLVRVVDHQLQRDLLRFASFILGNLAALTSEAAVLMERMGAYAICLTSADRPKAIRMAFESGKVLPPYAGASNKALLAFLPERVLAEAVEHARLEDPGLDLEVLQGELGEIFQGGFPGLIHSISSDYAPWPLHREQHPNIFQNGSGRVASRCSCP